MLTQSQKEAIKQEAEVLYPETDVDVFYLDRRDVKVESFKYHREAYIAAAEKYQQLLNDERERSKGLEDGLIQLKASFKYGSQFHRTISNILDTYNKTINNDTEI